MKIFCNFKPVEFFDFFVEKYKQYPITIYWDYPVSEKDIDKTQINIFITHEPNELFQLHTWVTYNQSLFDYILSWNKDLIPLTDNLIEFPCSWRPNNSPVYEFLGKKKFEISFLCGVKDITEGHKLRHKIYKIEDKIKIPKKWYYVLKDFDHKKGVRPGYAEYSKKLNNIPKEFKYEPSIWGKKFLYKNSMFNIGVENVQKDNQINDRAWSCFASKVVPIYWGCPNLEEIGYDERGVIRFNNENELIDIINNLTEKDYYDRLPYIEHNYQVSKRDTLEEKLCYVLDEIIKGHNL